MKPRVFSGIQPTGSPTIGNYIGAIRNWARDQDKFDNIFCLVDLHAITVPHDPAELRRDTWSLAALLLAAGIDPQRSLLFVQSQVPEHTTLAWLLNAVTSIGWLNRMTQFKTKAGKQREQASAGLYDYPVLMAADILLYHTQYVPVGEDQKQHVELTRDVAERFNSTFGETFTVPEPLIPEVGSRIMALDDPTKKMSKSEPDGAILLLDPPDVVSRKIKRAVTDSLGVVRFNPEQAGLYNLLTLIIALSGETPQQVEDRFSGKGYAAVKEEAIARVVAALEPLQQRYREYEASPEVVDRILAESAERAHQMAVPVVDAAEEKMGIWGTQRRGAAGHAAL